MSKRFLLITALIFMPFAAAADTDPVPTDETPAPAATEAPASAPADTTAGSAGLGPDSISPSAGGSNADATSLQPAGVAPIQATNGDSAGLTAPSGNALQAPASSSDALKVLSGEADGAPHQSDEPDLSQWTWPVFTILFLLILGAIVVVRDRRRFARSTPEDL